MLYVGSLQRQMLTHWASLYNHLDSRVYKLILFIKFWIRNHPQLGRYNKHFSDESILLLTVHFLNKIKVLPNLFSEFPAETENKSFLSFAIGDLPPYERFFICLCF